MFGKIVKGAAIIGIGYVVYKVGYAFGLRKVDPEIQKLDADFSMGKLTAQEYLQKYAERIKEIEGRR